MSFVVYWLADRDFDAGRGDFFYLADAFLHGRTWLDFAPGPYDVIVVGGPLLRAVRAVPGDRPDAARRAHRAAERGPVGARHQRARSPRASVGLCWWLVGRLGVRRLVDRVWLVLLFGFSTQILWVTTRGGVWHTGHLDRDDPDVRPA